MADEAVAAARGILPWLGRPAVIAHGAGNSPEKARSAIACGADLLEADVWIHGDQIEARHERALYPLPVFVDKWYLRFAPRRPFELTCLLKESAGSTPVFLDLKNGPGDVAGRLIRKALDECLPGEVVFASSQLWHVLRAVRGAAPEVGLLYSIDVSAQLALFRSVFQREQCAQGVSCNQRLLTEDVVHELRRSGLLVVAWTVDDPQRAQQLFSWGVDAITTHRVADIRALAQDVR